MSCTDKGGMRMACGLVLVDVQNDYFPGGSMELAGMEEAARNAAEVLASFRRTAAPAFHIRHVATRPGSTFFLPGTAGADIAEIVAPLKGEPVLEKHFPNSFRETTLADLLRENDVEEIVFCGAMTHMCIDTTVRAAFDLGFRCVVVDDACATRNLRFGDVLVEAAQVQAAFLAALSSPFARVISTTELLRERA